MLSPPNVEVLDASAMLAFLRGELGGDFVADLLTNLDSVCYAHVLNLTEVFYDIHRDGGEAQAQAAINLLAADVFMYEDFPSDLWMAAARLKSVHWRISLADCFLIALAQRIAGEVVTADHHEFDRLVPLDIVPIRFVR